MRYPFGSSRRREEFASVDLLRSAIPDMYSPARCWRYRFRPSVQLIFSSLGFGDWELVADCGVQRSEDARKPHIPASAAPAPYEAYWGRRRKVFTLRSQKSVEVCNAARFPICVLARATYWFAARLFGGRRSRAAAARTRRTTQSASDVSVFADERIGRAGADSAAWQACAAGENDHDASSAVPTPCWANNPDAISRPGCETCLRRLLFLTACHVDAKQRSEYERND